MIARLFQKVSGRPPPESENSAVDPSAPVRTSMRKSGLFSAGYSTEADGCTSTSSNLKNWQGQNLCREIWHRKFLDFAQKGNGAANKDEASQNGIVEEAMGVLEEWGRDCPAEGVFDVVFIALTSLFTDNNGDGRARTRRHRAIKAGLIRQMLATAETQNKSHYFHLMFACIAVLLVDSGRGDFAASDARLDAILIDDDGSLPKACKAALVNWPSHVGIQQSAQRCMNTLEPAIQRAAKEAANATGKNEWSSV